MKNYYLFTLIAFLLFSCKSENETAVPKGVKHAVKFEISTFDQEIIPYGRKMQLLSTTSSTDTVLEGLKIIYVVFNHRGELIKIIRPYENVIQDSLYTGNYTIAVIASYSPIGINDAYHGGFENDFPIDDEGNIIRVFKGDGSPFSDAYAVYGRGLSSVYRTTDTFFKKFSLSVGTGDVDQHVVLDRIVGKLQLAVEDFPGQTYPVTLIGEKDSFYFSSEQPFGSVEDLEKANQSNPYFLILNTNSPLTVKIGDKVIENVRVYKNKVTVLSGSLTSTDTIKAGFTVAVNNEWNTDTLYHDF